MNMYLNKTLSSAIILSCTFMRNIIIATLILCGPYLALTIMLHRTAIIFSQIKCLICRQESKLRKMKTYYEKHSNTWGANITMHNDAFFSKLLQCIMDWQKKPIFLLFWYCIFTTLKGFCGNLR